ncbi:hypothetical protein CYMTET_25644 [Cymbomonas tetramitiformis]|uniref:Uncharacterized protein n=1 Tax=Cymbomonas tetramitiformis TaxID=36881 RepID=A0AAE0KYU6_9CHLO|nr:hypothetical protein CYMTET_25644 [Cymbomonas tetramitiformis]
MFSRIRYVICLKNIQKRGRERNNLLRHADRTPTHLDIVIFKDVKAFNMPLGDTSPYLKSKVDSSYARLSDLEYRMEALSARSSPNSAALLSPRSWQLLRNWTRLIAHGLEKLGGSSKGTARHNCSFPEADKTNKVVRLPNRELGREEILSRTTPQGLVQLNQPSRLTSPQRFLRTYSSQDVTVTPQLHISSPPGDASPPYVQRVLPTEERCKHVTDCRSSGQLQNSTLELGASEICQRRPERSIAPPPLQPSASIKDP